MCPSCKARWRLVRNGTYSRQMIDERGLLSRIDIQRVRCRECRASHSLLYDFLVPYKRLTVKALAKAVTTYLRKPSSYMRALDDPINESATLFSAIEILLQNLPLAWMWLTTTLIAMGAKAIDLGGTGRCPNSWKSRKNGKATDLDFAAQVLERFPDLFSQASAAGYPLFAKRGGCRLLRTHSAEWQLF